MPDVLNKWLNQLKDFWQNLDKTQKKRIIITILAVISTMTIATIVLTKPSYITLVNNLSTNEIGEMSKILSENNIPHNIINSGSGIEVNAEDNGKAQIVLAQEGYPKGGITFEDAISMIGITTTENDKKYIWKQQQENEIAKKLMSHDNIEYAEISLALPEQSVFITSDQKEYLPTAYVMVKPKTTLTQNQIDGIVMMVSKSVERLEPENVTVVDNNLNILNSFVKADMYQAANSQEEIRAKKAKELEDKVYYYFSVGQYDSFDTLRVVANPYLDFDKSKTQSKIVTNPSDMDNGAVISKEEKTERSENVQAGSVPGTDANPGETTSSQYLIGTGGNSTSDLKEKKENYVYDETLLEEEKAVGYMVPEKSTMAISLWYGRNVQEESKLTEEFISQIRTAVSAATGIPVENISVNKYKLASTKVTYKNSFETLRDLISEYGLFIIIFLLILGMILTIILSKKHSMEPEGGTIGMTTTISEVLDTENLPEIELKEKSEIMRQIDKFIKEKPEAVAQLLRSWLSEDWNS